MIYLDFRDLSFNSVRAVVELAFNLWLGAVEPYNTADKAEIHFTPLTPIYYNHCDTQSKNREGYPQLRHVFHEM